MGSNVDVSLPRSTPICAVVRYAVLPLPGPRVTTPKEAAGGLVVAGADVTQVRWTPLRASSLVPVVLYDCGERRRSASPRPLWRTLPVRSRPVFCPNA